MSPTLPTQLHVDVKGGMQELLVYLKFESEAVNVTQVVYLTSVILNIFGSDYVSSEESQVHFGSLLLLLVCVLPIDMSITYLEGLSMFSLNP